MFKAAAAAPPAPRLPAHAADEVAWRYLSDTRDPEPLRRFIAEFPASPRRREAEMRIKALGQTNVAAAAPTPNASTPGQGSGPSVGKFDERAPSASGAAERAPQRVFLYEEDPYNPNGVQFVGTAVWRAEQITPAAGQKPEVVIRGEIEIPDQKISVHLTLSHNDDKQLPASHTVEIRFKLPQEFSHGGIANIPGIMVKQGETNRGIALNGIAVKVVDNFFRMGLSLADGEMQRNIRLLKERSWFDIPITYADGKRALIAVEKGPPGERAFAEAFAAWEQMAAAAPPWPTDVPASAPVESDAYVVQLAALQSEADAQAQFLRLQTKYSSVLGEHQPLIRRKDQGDRGIFFALQVGPFGAKSEADQLCDLLKSAGGKCFVQRN
jgi:hypothetical protein